MSVTTAHETKQRVRHPLDAVRSHIRRYVLLETAAAVLTFLALWFWVGLFVDFGSFWSFAYDWVLELDFADGGAASRAVRIAVIAIVLLGLVYVVYTKFFVRMWKEFSDPAVAMVLERRFPKELGDRLITAVELSDPKKAESYGFSGAMLQQTIDEAADRVERLPVSQVFDWARLRRQWFVVGLLTVGMFFAAMGVSLGVQAIRGRSTNVGEYLWSFAHNASIWTERNVLLDKSYWLRSAHLEVVRFQDNDDHPGEMRVGRDDARPDLVVRTVAWVVPDASAVGGWRALKVSELASFVDPEVFKKIDVPSNWDGWIVDLDDLDPKIPAGVVPAAWQDATAGETRKRLKEDPSLASNLEAAGALLAIKNLNDWNAWTFDKLLLQLDKDEVRGPLEKSNPAAVLAIAAVQAELEELAAQPRNQRRIRKLATPGEVVVYFRGRETKSNVPKTSKAPQKFVFGLDELKESVSFFARAADGVTAPLKIALVPPPAIREISVDKEEPAYHYHWVAGNQAALKKKRQYFRHYQIAASGDVSPLDVPSGTSLTMHVLVDRPLKDGIRIAPASQARDAGVIVPEATVTRDEGGLGFKVRFANVDKKMEFQFEYYDEDNVKGKRKVRITPIEDAVPEILNFEVGPVLRKSRGRETVAGGAALEGLLVTPDAILPFNGTIRDDVALIDARWIFQTQAIPVESAGANKPGRVVMQGPSGLRRASAIVVGLSCTSPFDVLTVPWHLNFARTYVEVDLQQQILPEAERSAPLLGFQESLKAEPEETLAQVAAASVGRPPRQKPFLREHGLKDREFFNVKQQLPNLVMKDAKSQMQIFHSLKVWLAATDNNVETGPSTHRTRTPITFLVVPEIELLAQVAIEEETLRSNLEKVAQKLKVAQTILEAQLPTMRAAKPETDYVPLAVRVDEVRKALLESGSSTREVHADYSRILVELQVNRVKRDKVDDVQRKIVNPLDLIVNPNTGNYALLEEILQGLSSKLEDEIANKTVVKNLPERVKTASLANDEIQRLQRELQLVLDAISGGIDEAQLVERIRAILDRQNEVRRPLEEHERVLFDEVIRRLTEPK